MGSARSCVNGKPKTLQTYGMEGMMGLKSSQAHIHERRGGRAHKHVWKLQKRRFSKNKIIENNRKDYRNSDYRDTVVSLPTLPHQAWNPLNIKHESGSEKNNAVFLVFAFPFFNFFLFSFERERERLLCSLLDFTKKKKVLHSYNQWAILLNHETGGCQSI